MSKIGVIKNQTAVDLPSNRTSEFDDVTDVDRPASVYNMEHQKRGVALVFNHEHFKNKNRELESRTGTKVDCENIAATLRSLDFDVKEYNNLTHSDILNEVEKVANMDHTENDCICITILSHGDRGYLYADDCRYKLDIILSYFTASRCPTLAGKPKLFFIQACQVDQLDAERTETDCAGSMSYRIPDHADFLIAYSTIPGSYSWRNTQKGSWFMQSLCQELNQYGKTDDILTLLTFVAQRVNLESKTPKQISCVNTMLTRLLYFNDK